jgi:glucoamylase
LIFPLLNLVGVSAAMNKSAFLFWVLGLSCLASHVQANDFQNWVQSEKPIVIQNLLANIGPTGAASGSVIASPSKANPNYFKTWIRDAALTMDTVITLYQLSLSKHDQNIYYQKLMDYIDFSRQNQTTPNLSGGLGEPLFNADGSAYTQGWGRPQNDGPAIRAYVLTRLAQILLSEGKANVVSQKLYRAEIPAYTVIKSDLEYVAHHWDETCFDLWEEVHGYHFFTRMVQRRAMLDGADLADRLNDGGAATYYRQQAQLIEAKLLSQWDDSKQIFVATVGRDGGLDYKSSGLDASVIVAILQGDRGDGFLPITDDRVLSTAAHLASTFQNLYPINQSGPGIAIGRYPEDHYDGYSTSGLGNPWVLLTDAFAQFYYRAANRFSNANQIAMTDKNVGFFNALLPSAHFSSGQIVRASDNLFGQITTALRQQGDAYLNCTKYHTGSDGALAEEMNRYNGYMQGAANLTWSDDSLLEAVWEGGM